jgi:hypothetical protein
MHDPASELLRIPLLRTSVNKVSSLHFLDNKFIGNSSSVCNNELTRVYLRAATVA